MPNNLIALQQKFHDKAVALAAIHAQAAQYYARQEQWLSLPLAILNGICSSGLIVSLATDNYPIFVVSCVLQLLATVLSSVVATIKPAQLKEQHIKAQTVAETVVEEIETQLALPESEQINSLIFIERIRNVLNVIRDSNATTPLPTTPVNHNNNNLTVAPAGGPSPPTAELFANSPPSASLPTLHAFQLRRLDGLLGVTGGSSSSSSTQHSTFVSQ